MKVETEVDIFTTGISVDPTFGEFEEELREADEASASRIWRNLIAVSLKKSRKLT